MRSWSKKIWPTCEEWVVELLPRRVPLVRMVVVLAAWARTWMWVAPVWKSRLVYVLYDV
jgi:hypothetical protein